MDPSIYCIENVINNKKYIGSTNNISKRWRSHRNLLKNNRHSNIHLQTAWNFYGEENFKFFVIEENIDILTLLLKEDYYINLYEVLDREKGYNIAKSTTAPMHGRKHTAKSLEKMKTIKTGEKNSFYGKHHTEETKAKLRKTKLGKKLSPTHREKVLKTGHKTGEENINSTLTQDKVFEIRKEYKNTVNKRGICKILSIKYQVHYTTIRRIVKNETWKEEEINETSR
jgi:group I intron endonuclease